MTEDKPTWTGTDGAGAFAAPNYTQVPNDFFDRHMAHMGEAELRVCLCIIRQTVGYHRTRVRFAQSKIERMTGLSDEGVRRGIAAAEKHGFLTRERSDGGVTTWTLNVTEAQPPNDVGPNNVDSPTTLGSLPNDVGPHLLKKELKKGRASHAREPRPQTFTPAVTALYEVSKCRPTQAQADLITAEVGDRLDEWRSVVAAWCVERGFSPRNVGGMLEWLRDGIPKGGRQNGRKPEVRRGQSWTQEEIKAARDAESDKWPEPLI